jgi:hypothetical protein
MSKDRKTRPSFAPDSSPPGESGASTGWVYRSEGQEGGTLEADNPWRRGFNPAQWVGRVQRTSSRWSTRFLEVASVPFALAIVTAMPAASWISRGRARRPRPDEATPSAR